MTFERGLIEKICPSHDRILVQKTKQNENTTPGGILIPDQQEKERAQTGKVISVGAGKMNTQGVIVPVHVKIGQHVLFGKYAGTELVEDFVMLREDEIIGTF